MSAVRNPHAVQRLARQARAQFPLELIGHGLDTIIQHTHRPATTWLERLFYPGGFQDRALPIEPTAQQRIDRYYTALHYGPVVDSTPYLTHWRREIRGEDVKLALRLREAARSTGNVHFIEERRAHKRAKEWSYSNA